MAAVSRREFGRIALAGVPLAAAGWPAIARAFSPVVLGVTTSSFRDLPRVTGRDNVDDVVRALTAIGATHIDLALSNVEPAPPNTAPFLGGSAAYPQRIVLTPEQIAATDASARSALRVWRLQTPAGAVDAVRSKLAAAGISVHACTLAYDASFSDEEIDATFRQAKALGANAIGSTMTMATAARLAPFAERHRVIVAIHNQPDGNAGRFIATPDLKPALALSSSFKLKLDVGNLTASNCDAVAELRAHRGRVSHVLLKDRLRNGGASQPFGAGDTPLAGVLEALRADPAIPAFVEYDYLGLRSSIEEVKTAVAYVKRTAG